MTYFLYEITTALVSDYSDVAYIAVVLLINYCHSSIAIQL